jgi:hypothetical protein
MELVAPTLDSAARNFSRFEHPGSVFSGVLLLAESARERIFERIEDASTLGKWRVHRSLRETQTLIAEAEGHRLAIVCGRQVRCALGLEVLALGTTATYPEGRGLEETVERVIGDGALAAVPWGFGKWIGRAGAHVSEFFSRGARNSVFAGDNGGRLRLLPRPKLLDVAREEGFGILPGTDPFAFGHDYRRVGAFGFLAAVELDSNAPWRALQEWLENCPDCPVPYGRALNPIRFLFNQCWIQVHNRLPHRSDK